MEKNASYLNGLLDGVTLDENKPETKVIKALVEVIGNLEAEIATLKEDTEMLNDYIEEIDEDLGDVEDVVYDIDDCDCCDDDDCDCCDCCGDDDEDGEFYCAMCPNCGEKIYFDESCDPEEVICPSCQAPLISDDDECDCDECK
ncbi:MAG: hypothetical protein MJ096_04540 [Clostridia bacterium]|nr:hypothetical protein [Clostridia bacterium]